MTLTFRIEKHNMSKNILYKPETISSHRFSQQAVDQNLLTCCMFGNSTCH